MKRKNIYLPIILVFFTGLALRLYYLYSCHPMFSSDGLFYLQQAKALYLGQMDRFTACYPSPNIYPFIILISYWITGHWIIAAKCASLLFATATLIPLYLLMRRFFSRPMASCVLLLVAVNPTLVRYSSEIVRGPVYWFLLTSGMLLIVRALENRNRTLCLTAGSLVFLVASWARIEAVSFLFATPLFFIFSGEPGKKLKDTALFIAPLAISGIMATVIFFAHDSHRNFSMLPREVIPRLKLAWLSYNDMRQGLKILATRQFDGILPGFFSCCRNLIWWIAMGDVLNIFSMMSFQPFLPFFLGGFKKIRSSCTTDIKLRYLLFLGITAFLVIFCHDIITWTMSRRFMVLIFFPLLVIWGRGIERFTDFIHSRTKLDRTSILLITSCIIFMAALPQNLKTYSPEKLVLPEIGMSIAAHEKGRHVTRIAGCTKWVDFVNLFANLEVNEAPCYHQELISSDLHGDKLLLQLQKHDYDYFLWNEKSCSPITHKDMNGLIELKGWKNKKFGRMILFKVQSRGRGTIQKSTTY